MKNEILKFFKTDRTFTAGTALYMKHGVNMGFKKTLNLQGYTKYNQELLFEELRKLANISSTDFKILLSKSVEKIKVEIIEPENAPAQDLDPNRTLLQIPEQVKKAIRLRDEFPFLSSPDCPNELKILVADMLTAYDNYVDAHKELFEATDNESALKAVAATVENYLENRAIWAELEHYKTNGEILGNHPIFEQNDKFKELKGLTTQDLYQRKATLYNAIARKRKQLKDNTKPEFAKQRQDSLAEKEAEYKEVLRLLNINE